MTFKLSDTKLFADSLESFSNNKLLVQTINAHSFNVAQKDALFAEALLKAHVLLPDGISVVWSYRLLRKKKVTRITGTDLFLHEMNRVNKIGGRCFFMGSSEQTLAKMRLRAGVDFPNVQINTYSPPFKENFSDTEEQAILQAIDEFKPDVLFVGMTAPKQEKWSHANFDRINAKRVCSIGAVFDFYAGNIKRAPKWIQNLGFEWLYRFLQEPTRLWRRYLVGNFMFVCTILKELISTKTS